MYPTRAIIDLDAIRHNYMVACTLHPGKTIVPVVKSDAYGHGALRVVHALEGMHCPAIAVFRVEEALPLKAACVAPRIWVLLGALDSEIEAAMGQDLVLACYSLENARRLNEAAGRHRLIQDIHIKVDTGMGRLGVLPEDVPAFLKELAAMPNLRVTGAFSHMAIAADPNHPVTKKQLANFDAVCAVLPESCTERHLCATMALFNDLKPELKYERLGISLYGSTPEPGLDFGLKPAMTFASKLISVKKLPKGHTISYNCSVTLERDSIIAVAPVGYASGLPRCLTNQCEALVRGHRVRNFGNVCMDMTMFDVTDVPGVAVDDDIVLIGSQGKETITAWDVASKINTIPYELMCRIGMTQPRFYVNEQISPRPRVDEEA